MENLKKIESLIISLSRDDKIGRTLNHLKDTLNVEDLVDNGHHPLRILKSLGDEKYSFLLTLFSDAISIGDKNLKQDVVRLVAKVRVLEDMLVEYENWMRLLKVKTIMFILIASVFSAVMAGAYPVLAKFVYMIKQIRNPIDPLYIASLYWLSSLFASTISTAPHEEKPFTIKVALLSTLIFWIAYLLMKSIFVK